MTIASGDSWELRLGRWQDVLGDVKCDSVITDPPYSERTHDGFRTSGYRKDHGLGYRPIDRDYAFDFVRSWATRCRGWMVVFGDHISSRWFEEAMEDSGRYTFHPLPIVKIGAPPRLSADGPSSQSEWMIVSRPKEKRFLSWGSLPGWYSMQTVRHGHGAHGVTGAKSLDFMRAVVRDYSRPGDVIAEPHTGSGTTLLAARMEGRRSIGAEMMPEHFEIARRRLAHLPQSTEKQPALFGGDG